MIRCVRPASLIVLVLWVAALFGGGSAAAEELQFFGDVLLSRGIGKLAGDRGTAFVRNGVAPFLSSNAVRVANLEGAVGPASSCAGKHDPCFPVSRDLLPLLDGFDVVSLQNNHALDLGRPGLAATIRAIGKRGIAPLGGRNVSMIIRTGKGDVGIVAVTDVLNAPGDRRHVVLADAPEVPREIGRLKKRCGVVAVYAHWGRELDDLPSARMRDLAAGWVRAGADLVVGAHPHVSGKVEIVEGRPVVYSLGNFLFDQKYAETKRGVVLSCGIDNGSRLACRLSGTRVPMDGFLPSPSEGGFPAENELLARVSPDVTPTWADRFMHNRKGMRLRMFRDGQKPGHSFLELQDISTGRTILRTPSMPIVRVQPVDIDGDGVREVYLLLRLYSSLDGEVAKRVYIYSLDGTFRALWRGSALSRPLEDALFLERPGMAPLLVALHTTDSFLLRNPARPGRIVMSYRWNGFGFTGRKEMKVNKTARELSSRKGMIRLVERGTIVWSVGGGFLEE